MINSSFVDRKLQYKGHKLHFILSNCMGKKWNKMSKFCLQITVDVYDGDIRACVICMLYIDFK